MDHGKWIEAARKSVKKPMSQRALSRELIRRLGINSEDQSIVNKVVKGRRDLSPEEVFAIEAITGFPAPSSLRQRSLIGSFDPFQVDPADDAHDRFAESGVGMRSPDLPDGAILEADLKVGLGQGQVAVPGLQLLHPSSGETYAAEGVRDWWRVPEHFVRGRFRVPVERIRCFQSDGDSMWPTIADGDMVFVDIGHRIVSPDGLYAVADMYGGVSCKRLTLLPPTPDAPAMLRVSSDNEGHPSYNRDPEQVTIVGRYLGRLTIL